jgi:2-methylcitrate dehydratase PrpD
MVLVSHRSFLFSFWCILVEDDVAWKTIFDQDKPESEEIRMGLATDLATRIANFNHDALPDEAIHWAKVGILDTVGVGIAGADEDCVTILEKAIATEVAGGPCQLFGKAARRSPLDAALINGTACHAHDFDDCNDTLGGHPSAPILPALFALAEETGAVGRDIMTAYIVGFETETAIARGVHFHHYEKGWHPTATLGTFGAAAACARLMGLSVAQIEIALALCTSFAAGIKANFGTMTKPFHVGQSSRAGMLAARMAREGFTANPDAFEHSQGFFEVFNGAGNYDPSKVLQGWADPLNIVEPGVVIKQYPCCGSTHSAIDAMLALVRDHGLTPDNVARIELTIHKRRLKHTDRPDPRTDLDAKFSIQYCLARALRDGRVTLDQFEGDAHLDSGVRSIMDRIQADPHDDSNHFSADVTVTTTDGRTLGKHVDQALGRGTRDPLPGNLLKAKFETCAGRILPAGQVVQLYQAIMAFDEIEKFDEFAALLKAPDLDASIGAAAE